MFVTTYIKMMRVKKNKNRVVRYIAYFDYEGNLMKIFSVGITNNN